MANVIGGPVLPHVQAFADELERRFGDGISHISTYAGHQPTRERALDVFPKTQADGDRIAEWATDDAVADHFGLDYHIWWQRIWNRTVKRAWRAMADRGSKTANHKDHGHFSFGLTGAAKPGTTSQGDDELTPEEKAALSRIDQRVANLEKAMADLHPEVLESLVRIEAKLDR